MIEVKVNDNVLAELLKAFDASPKHFAQSLAKAFRDIGKSDITKLRSEQLSGGGRLNVKHKGLKNSAKYKATDANKATVLSKIFLDEYMRWPGAEIFQVGGTVTPKKAKSLTILTDAARNASGKRKISRKQFRSMMASGELQVIPLKNGDAIVVRQIGKLNAKTGNLRKGSRTEIVARLVKSVRQIKRLSFFENSAANQSEHNKFLGMAAESALKNFAKELTSKGSRVGRTLRGIAGG